MKKYIISRIIGSHHKFFLKIETSSFKYGKPIIIKTEKGEHLAYINSFPVEKEPEGKDLKKATFSRYALATEVEQESKNREWLKKQKKEIAILGKKSLPTMKISHLRTDLDRKVLLVYYTASTRVDFRDFLKELKYLFKVDVIFNQMTSRQRFECFYHPPHITYKSFMSKGHIKS